MANKHTELLEKYIHERLGSTDEILKHWYEDPYPANGAVVEKLWQYIENAPAVVIVGDYDCDGICASYIMSQAIHFNYPKMHIRVRTPRRFSEGYGINMPIAEEIIQNMPKGTLVLTVDNGIAAASVLEYLEEHGYPVIMTDHHELREDCRIPEVSMTIDPSVKELENPLMGDYWCGAAVAYKLCAPMLSEEKEKELSVYAGIATIADCMDLKEGNWGLVKRTIQMFREGKTPRALNNLLLGMSQNPIYCREDTIGFYIGPAFNAPGRLLDKGAMQVLEYLDSPSKEKCEAIIDLNNRRKELRDEQYSQVVEWLKATGHIDDCPLWVSLPGLHEGIVGILAGKLAEDFKRPAIVVTSLENQPSILKGSARNYGDFNIFEYLSSLPEGTFLKMGGHKGAAGLSMTEESFWAVSSAHPVDLEKIAKGAKNNSVEMLIDKWEIPELNNLLNKFRPFGQSNEAPKFEVEVDIQKDKVKMLKQIHLCIEGPKLHPEKEKDFSVQYKLLHFNHEPNDLKNPTHFLMKGTIGESGFQDVITPQFLAKEIMDLEEEK